MEKRYERAYEVEKGLSAAAGRTKILKEWEIAPAKRGRGPQIRAERPRTARQTKKKNSRKIGGGIFWGALSGVVLDMLLILTTGELRVGLCVVLIVVWVFTGVAIARSRWRVRGAARGIALSLLFWSPVAVFLFLSGAAAGFWILSLVWSTVWAGLLGVILD